MRRTFSMLSLPAGLLILLLLAGCADTPDLPTSVATNPDDFGANDTSFVRITPDWDAAAGFDWQSPHEIHIARDGYIYVADETNGGRIQRMQLSGNVLRDDLFREVIDTSGRPAIGLGQDSKLNLLMANGSNVIHAHNTVVETIGLASVIVSFDVIDLDTGDRHTIDDSAPIWQQVNDLVASGVDSFEVDLESAVSSSDPAMLEEYSKEWVFLADTTGERMSQFTDVDGGPRGEERIFVSDQGNDRIAQYAILPVRILELEDGTTTYRFEAVYAGDVVEFGQGQVSTNNPTSVVSSGQGTSVKLYFTQVDGNFLVQRLRPAGPTWQFDIPTVGDGPPLIELNYFGDPVAVAVGESDDLGLGLFYVADSTQNRVTAFYPGGSTFRHVGSETELIDLEPGQALSDRLDALGLEFDPALNHDLVDYYASEPVQITIESGQTLEEAVEANGYSFDPLLNPELNGGTVFDTNRTMQINIAAATTVEVNFPLLNSPRGVATQEGVVYIADSGNDRIVRYRRSDSDAYIPDDPNL